MNEDEPVEFEKELVLVQDFRKFTKYFRGIQAVYFKYIKREKTKDVNMKLGNTRISTDYAKKSPGTPIRTYMP